MTLNLPGINFQLSRTSGQPLSNIFFDGIRNILCQTRRIYSYMYFCVIFLFQIRVSTTSVLGHVQIRESVTLCSFFCVGDLSEFVEEKIIKEKKNVKTRCSATS